MMHSIYRFVTKLLNFASLLHRTLCDTCCHSSLASYGLLDLLMILERATSGVTIQQSPIDLVVDPSLRTRAKHRGKLPSHHCPLSIIAGARHTRRKPYVSRPAYQVLEVTSSVLPLPSGRRNCMFSPGSLPPICPHGSATRNALYPLAGVYHPTPILVHIVTLSRCRRVMGTGMGPGIRCLIAFRTSLEVE